MQTALSLRLRFLATLALVGVVLGLSTCDEALDVAGLDFQPDSCVEFNFWRNDTLLVKTLEIGVVRSDVDTGLLGCRLQNWDFEEDDSWIQYALDEFAPTCNVFDAEVHVGNRYYEVTSGYRTVGTHFAEGEWKLHEVTGSVDKIIDGGDFEFIFDVGANCE